MACAHDPMEAGTPAPRSESNCQGSQGRYPVAPVSTENRPGHWVGAEGLSRGNGGKRADSSCALLMGRTP